MDKIYRINGHEVKFYCNEENRIVRATIERCRNNVLDAVRDDFGLDIDIFSTAERFIERCCMINSMSCVARCHPDDEFNEELGKRVAYKKLRKKYWSKYAKRMYNLATIYVHASTHCMEDAQKAYDRADQITL